MVMPERDGKGDGAGLRTGGHRAHTPTWGNDTAQSLAVGPFASGGIDIRSRRFAQMVVAAGFDARFAHAWTSEGGHRGCEDYRRSCGADEWAGACDGLQGYLVARTLRGAQVPVNVTVLHLTGRKFHAPPPGASTSVMHAGELKRARGWTAPPANWRFYSGKAMLPIPMRLLPTTQGVGWRAEDPQQVDAFFARSRSGALCGGTDAQLPCASVPPAADLHPK